MSVMYCHTQRKPSVTQGFTLLSCGYEMSTCGTKQEEKTVPAQHMENHSVSVVVRGESALLTCTRCQLQLNCTGLVPIKFLSCVQMWWVNFHVCKTLSKLIQNEIFCIKSTTYHKNWTPDQNMDTIYCHESCSVIRGTRKLIRWFTSLVPERMSSDLLQFQFLFKSFWIRFNKFW